MRGTLASVLATAILLSAPALVFAATPEQKCEAGKNLAAGKYAACTAKAEAVYVKSGDPAKYGAMLLSCSTKFNDLWLKLQAAAVSGGAACPSLDDQTLVGDYLDTCLQGVAEQVSGGAAPELCGGPGTYQITFSQTDMSSLGALQIAVDYSTADGSFSGSGGSVVCQEPFGALSAFNDVDASHQLNAGWITLSDQPGPLLLSVCDFDATTTPSASDFVITIVDATDDVGMEVMPPPTIAVTVAMKL